MLGNEIHVEILSKLKVPEMNFKDFLPLLEVRKFNMDLTVETTCSHEGLVEDISTVSCSKDDYTRIRAESIHLCKELIQSIFTLVVRRESSVLASGTSHCVDLVNEDDARRLLLCLTEEVTYTGRSHTDKHLHEIRTGNREERHISLTGNSLGKKGFTCTRRAYEKGSLRNLTAECCIFLRILEEIDDFHHFIFRSIKTGHILECNLYAVLFCEFACRLAYVEDTASTAATHVAVHTAEHEYPHQDEKKREDQPFKNAPETLVCLDNNLYSLPFWQLIVEFAEHLLCIEAAGYKENEMRRFLWQDSAELVLKLAESVRLDGHLTFKLISDKHDLLDVTGKPLLLYLIPLFLLRIGTVLTEQHPTDSDKEQDIYP